MASTDAPTPLFAYDDMPSSPLAGEGELPLTITNLISGTPPPANDTIHAVESSPNASGASSPSPEEFGTPSSTTGRRRRANEALEDLTQHVDWAARRVRLKTSGTQELKKIAKLSYEQRQLLNTAMLLKLSEQVEAIAPADAQWTMSENLKEKIEQYTFAVLCSPKLEFYVKKQGPTKLLLGIFERHASWGYTKEVKNDKYKRDIIASRIGTRFTDRRSDIKEIIVLSLGPGIQPSPAQTGSTASSGQNRTTPRQISIVELCEMIITKGPKSICEDVTVTLQMCVRFAFLRKVMVALIKTPQMGFDKYWTLVDAQLLALREKDEAMITRQLTSYLNTDLSVYGRTPPPHAVLDTHETQQVVDLAVAGVLEDDTDN